MSTVFTKLTEQYPFITLCVYGTVEYVGVVLNRDDQVTTIYDFGSIHDLESKRQFLELAAEWWWESNRMVPINIFLKHEIEPFRVYLRTFSNKDLEILHGPACSLKEMVARRSKRKSITLVKRVP